MNHLRMLKHIDKPYCEDCWSNQDELYLWDDCGADELILCMPCAQQREESHEQEQEN
jgi:hypothetical protein